MKNLGNAEVDWMFQTAPQSHCNDRQIIVNRSVAELFLVETHNDVSGCIGERDWVVQVL